MFRRAALPLLSRAFVACALLAAPAAGANQREGLVVSTTWLAEHLHDANLVLLQVGPKEDYPARHIPGARYVDYSEDLAVSDHTGVGLMLEMPPAATLRDRLAALGISDDSRIVVYYGKDWLSPTTRVLFTLDYAGLGDRSALLDGGLEAWAKDGRPVTDAVPPAKTGTLAPLKLRPIVVDAAYVKAHLHAAHTAIVDGRAASYYEGVETGETHRGPHKRGHIAGAHSVPFTEIFDDTLHLRPAAELAALFDKAGVKADDTVIGYCQIGQQATAMLFAARSLGHPVLLYDGSFEDWSRQDDSFPVEAPAPAAAPHAN
jgi:thiosulfate/3-mercaptopyruvate sulfurtransferase